MDSRFALPIVLLAVANLPVTASPARLATAALPSPFIGGSDACATPDPLTGLGTFVFDTTLATTGIEGQASACGAIDDDVWFAWTATFTGVATVSTCVYTTLDTKLAVYSTPCAVGVALACNDDTCGLQSQVTFPCTVGGVYVIQVGDALGGGGGGGIGAISISTASCPAPANDACSSTATISGTGAHNTDTTCSSAESGTSTCSGSASGDVWYQWTAGGSGSGEYEFSVCSTSSPYRPRVSLHTSQCGPVYNNNCGSPKCGDGWSICQYINAGLLQTTFYIRVSGDSNSSSEFEQTGTAVLSIERLNCNNRCETAEIIILDSPVLYETNYASTGTEGQSQGICNFGGQTGIENDVWYQFQAPYSGPFRVTTCGLTAIDTKIAVYDGSGCPAGAAIACNDDACSSVTSELVFAGISGQSYVIQVGNSPGTTPGAGQLLVTGVSPGTPYCFGDGTGTACPCGNIGAAGNGCANSVNPNGASLTAAGAASISADTLQLSGSGMPSGSALYYQGTSQVSTVFGDGLRCAGGSVIRLGVKFNVGGTSQYPTGGDISIGVRGLNVPGNVRTYQAWYRNASAFCTPSTFNLSNGLTITWNA